MSNNYPNLFDINFYRSNNYDLSSFSTNALLDHYFFHGLFEGRPGNKILNRNNFTSLIDLDLPTLEIGPFANPLVKGKNVKYFDILDSDSLKERAKQHHISTANIPNEIHFVGSNIDCIKHSFSNVVSSHVIEHQPDFLGHLNSIENLLCDNGIYFICIPDKRFCFDHNFSASTIADILTAHYEKRKIHTLKSVIEHRCLTTHNDPSLYWKERGRVWPSDKLSIDSLQDALKEYEMSLGSYIDVHAFFFTPSSFYKILKLLFEINLTKLKVKRIYPTRTWNNEFWVILKKGDVLDPDPNLWRLE